MQYLLDILLRNANKVIQLKSGEESRVQHKARETVIVLTKKPPIKYIDFVDDNVAGCIGPVLMYHGAVVH